MKTIGLLGGISWESTSSYYKLLNQKINQKLGGLHSAKIVMTSVDFAEISKLQHQGDWQKVFKILSGQAAKLENSGVDAIMICANTIHMIADEIMESLQIPLIHMVDVMGAELQKRNIQKVGLLGTKFTMEKPFYKERIANQYDIEVLVPNKKEQSIIHDVIYDELCKGVILNDSRSKYLEIIKTLSARGAQAVISGCTEIGMLINQEHTQIKLIDSLEIHVDAAVDFALK